MSAPLTPEEIVDNNSEFYDWGNDGFWAVPKHTAENMLIDYAALQTAAKDEQLAENEKYMKESDLLISGLQEDIKEKDERIKELEEDIRIAKDVESEYLTQVKENKNNAARIAELEEQVRLFGLDFDKVVGKRDELFEKVEQLKLAAQLLGETGIQLQKERDQAYALLGSIDCADSNPEFYAAIQRLIKPTK